MCVRVVPLELEAERGGGPVRKGKVSGGVRALGNESVRARAGNE
jgi:hypothetical protein